MITFKTVLMQTYLIYYRFTEFAVGNPHKLAKPLFDTALSLYA